MPLIEMSLRAALIIVITAALRTAGLHRLPKTGFLVLWGIALVRLFLPVQIPLAFSSILPGSLQEVVISAPPGLRSISTMPSIHKGIPTVVHETPDWTVSFLLILWSMGMLITAIFLMGSHFHYRRYYKLATPAKNEFIRCWLKQNSLTFRKVQVQSCGHINEALTYGLFRPVILLPEFTSGQDSEHLFYILVHEMTHIRRWDVLWKWLLVMAVCLHWFNPAVWLMYFLANRDLEITCDERVLQKLSFVQRKEYALTLIEAARYSRRTSPIHSAFSKNPITERIESMLRIKKKSRPAIIVSAVTAVILFTAAFASAADTSRQQNTRGSRQGAGSAELQFSAAVKSALAESQEAAPPAVQMIHEVPVTSIVYGPQEENPYYDIHSSPNTVYTVHLDQTADDLDIDGDYYHYFLEMEVIRTVQNLNIHPSHIGFTIDPATALIYLGEADSFSSTVIDIFTTGYEVNEYGETYGIDHIAQYIGVHPDLTAATGLDGTEGYLRREDIHPDSPESPEEALRIQREREKNRETSYLVPLYATDGRTVIGEFEIGTGHALKTGASETGDKDPQAHLPAHD